MSPTAFNLFEKVLSHLQIHLLSNKYKLNSDEYIRNVSDFFMRCLRISIRDRNKKLTTISLHYCNEVALNLRTSQQRSPSNFSLNSLNQANQHFWTYWFAIVSYTHMELQTEPTDNFLLNTFVEMSELIPPKNLWSSYFNFTSDDVADRPWTWWETEKWSELGIKAGSLGLLDDSAHFTLAFRLINDPSNLIDNLNTEKSNSAQTEHLLKNVIESLDNAMALRILVSPERPLAEINEVKRKLEALQNESAKQQVEDELNLQLVPEKVKAFHSSAQRLWTKSSALRDDSNTQLQFTERSEQFGLTNRVTRHYFTDNPGVFADPSDLARQMASSLRDGEAKLILDQIMEIQPTIPPKSIKLGDIKSKVRDALKAISSPEFEPKIYVFNSILAFQSLCPNAIDFSSSDIIHTFEGVDVRLEHLGDHPLCVVADLEKAIQINRWKHTNFETDEELSIDKFLKSKIRMISNDEAEKLVTNNLGFLKTGDGLVKTHDRAVSDLLNSVVVSLWTKVEIKLTERRAVEFFRIEDD